MGDVIQFRPRNIKAAKSPQPEAEQELSLEAMKETICAIYLSVVGAIELVGGKPAADFADHLLHEMAKDAPADTAALCRFVVDANAPIEECPPGILKFVGPLGPCPRLNQLTA